MVLDFVTLGAGGEAGQINVVTLDGSINYMQTNPRCYDRKLRGSGSHM